MLHGKCLCGAIRYEIDGVSTSETNCHCSICRRASGASPVAWFTVPRASLRFTAGKPVEYQSSAHATRGFCSTCGSQLTFHTLKAPDAIDITTCTLDNPEQAAPRAHIHASSKLPWVPLPGELPVYAEEKPGS
jgi:hypothetical protein